MNEPLILSQANVGIRAGRIHLKNRVGPVTDMRAKERILITAGLMDATRPTTSDFFRRNEKKMFAGLSGKGA